MALIDCPECGAQVSSLAVACPKCAAPIAAAGAAQSVGQQVTTTELTAKKFKKHAAIGAGMCVIGIILMITGRESISSAGAGMGLTAAIGAASLVFGAALFITSRIRAWWHHG